GTSDSDTFTLTATLNTGSKTIDSGQMQFGLLSDTTLESSARFYSEDGSAIGSGSMPPQVDSVTRYQMMFRTSNTLHDVKTSVVIAQLASNVRFAGEIVTTIGTIIHDEQNRSVTWKIGDLPATDTIQTASFFVEATPGSGDSGAFMPLLSSAEFTGVDAKTEGTIVVSTEKVTTELFGDPFALNQGIVVE
ncbi:MAG: hypothetical protein O3B96_00810, partial [bacterium]|nr:hypothetical protein [bacterium]